MRKKISPPSCCKSVRIIDLFITIIHIKYEYSALLKSGIILTSDLLTLWKNYSQLCSFPLKQFLDFDLVLSTVKTVRFIKSEFKTAHSDTVSTCHISSQSIHFLKIYSSTKISSCYIPTAVSLLNQIERTYS